MKDKPLYVLVPSEPRLIIRFRFSPDACPDPRHVLDLICPTCGECEIEERP